MSLLLPFYQLIKDRVWANQHTDRHAIFKLKRISPSIGVKGGLALPMFNTWTPDYPNSNSYFILYEIGGFQHNSFGIDNDINLSQWISLSDLVGICNLFVIIFSDYRILTLSDCYIRMTANGTVIVAVKRETNIDKLESNDPVYIRFYSNTNTELLSQDYYSHFSLYITNINDINSEPDYDNFKDDFDATNNTALGFLNGYIVPEGFPSYTASIGSKKELQYFIDPDIINFITIPKSEFIQFSKDGTDYLIACSDELSDNMYCDDIEFFITGYSSLYNHRYGLYIPRFSQLHIGQLTFNDWYFKKSHWDEIEANLQSHFSNSMSDIQLHVVVRNSGNNFFYVQDSSRLTDLMNLPVNIRKMTYTHDFSSLPFEVNVTLDLWRATNLIDSRWNTFLGLREKELEVVRTTLEDISLFGPTTYHDFYNTITSYGCIEILEGVRYNPYSEEYMLPFFTHESGWRLNFVNGEYSATNDTIYSGTATPLLEFTGVGNEIYIPKINENDNLDIYVPINEVETNIEYGFRFICYWINNGVPELCISGTDYIYEDIWNNLNEEWDYTKVIWSNEMQDKVRYIRTSNRLIKYTKVLTNNDIIDGWDVYNGRLFTHDVGMGKLMIWYNGRYLIEGLDYTLFERKIYLHSKVEWMFGGTDTVEVIYAGIPDHTLRHVNNDEWGFISKGKISYDNRYDLYHNRHRLIVASGKVLEPNQFFTSENYKEINLPGTLDEDEFPNGTPFSLVKLPRFSRLEEVEIFAIPEYNDTVIDNEIEIFLSTIYPQATDTTPIIIPSKYDLYSPFMNKVVDEIMINNLVISTNTYTDQEISDMVEPYKYLLDADPSLMNMPWEWVEVNPIRQLITHEITPVAPEISPLEININEYWFINQLNRIFLNNKVKNINRHFSIV